MAATAQPHGSSLPIARPAESKLGRTVRSWLPAALLAAFAVALLAALSRPVDEEALLRAPQPPIPVLPAD